MTHSGSIYELSEKSNGQKPTRIRRKISFFGMSLNGTFPIEDMPWPVLILDSSYKISFAASIVRLHPLLKKLSVRRPHPSLEYFLRARPPAFQDGHRRPATPEYDDIFLF